MRRIAVYPGTFDPVTLGHLWVIGEATKIFDEVIVCVADNGAKRPSISVLQRMTLISESLIWAIKMRPELLRSEPRVDSFEGGFIVGYARENGASFIVRGIRSSTDLEKEIALGNVYRDVNPAISIVHLIPPRHWIDISSSLVRELVTLDGALEGVIGRYVPEPVSRYYFEANKGERQ